jgi:Zn-dependent peptidase ImmA (M78 family)
MEVTRLDLDGTGSPEGLVGKILKAEPKLSYPIPIEDLAKALDIQEIGELETKAFEGSLLMDRHRSSGLILVNKAARGGRRRFTIGHELGHFCIVTHKPIEGDRFLCSRDDMRRWSASEQDAYARMEVEANRFSALLLMPPPMLRNYMSKLGDPDLAQVLAIHHDFDVSKDAAARAYAQHHDEPIAVVVVCDGMVLRTYKHIKFPKFGIQSNGEVPKRSLYWRTSKSRTTPSELSEIAAELWLESERGKPPPDLFEQVLHQQFGYALVLLWPELKDEEDEHDPDENLTSKQRLTERRARWLER